MDPRDEARIADPTIGAVLDEYIMAERVRLSHRTYRRYRDVVVLLILSLNETACNSLPAEEKALYLRLRDADVSGHRGFTEIFGPDHILPHFDEFLRSFLHRRTTGDKSFLRAAGTVTRKLAKWLERQGYVGERSVHAVAARAAEAAESLPAAEDLGRLLNRHSERTRLWAETAKGHFTFTRVEGETIWVDDIAGRVRGPIRLPVEVALRCRIGWTFYGTIGRRGDNWSIAEVRKVYPAE